MEPVKTDNLSTLTKARYSADLIGIEEVFEAMDKLQGYLDAYDAAADKFLRKCDTGRARSVETQNDMRRCRARAL